MQNSRIFLKVTEFLHQERLSDDTHAVSVRILKEQSCSRFWLELKRLSQRLRQRTNYPEAGFVFQPL